MQMVFLGLGWIMFDSFCNLGKKLYRSGVDFGWKKVRSFMQFKRKIHMRWFPYMAHEGSCYT